MGSHEVMLLAERLPATLLRFRSCRLYLAAVNKVTSCLPDKLEGLLFGYIITSHAVIATLIEIPITISRQECSQHQWIVFETRR